MSSGKNQPSFALPATTSLFFVLDTFENLPKSVLQVINVLQLSLPTILQDYTSKLFAEYNMNL